MIVLIPLGVFLASTIIGPLIAVHFNPPTD